MSIPGQKFTFHNNGNGRRRNGGRKLPPLYIGYASGGSAVANEIYTLSPSQSSSALLGQGVLAEDCAYAQSVGGGGAFYVMVLDASVAAAISSADPQEAGVAAATRVGSSTGTITISGTPHDGYDGAFTITRSGGLGDARFQYTLDGGASNSKELVVPAGGVYLVPGTGLTATWTPGAGQLAFEAGDAHSFTTEAPWHSAVDLQAGYDALLATKYEPAWLALCGTPTSAVNSATLFAAQSVHLAALGNSARWTRLMLDAGSTDTPANVIAAYTGVASDRLLAAYGRGRVVSAKPLPGWTKPKRSLVGVLSAWAQGYPISADLKRTAEGPMPGVSDIEHDERIATTTLDEHGITTFRTWIKKPGIYPTQGRYKSAPSSDYDLWPKGLIMDEGARTIYGPQIDFIGSNPRSNIDPSIEAGMPGAVGTMDERDARRLEKKPKRLLRAALSTPINADGEDGHVSGWAYAIDRAHDIQTNKNIRTTLDMVPLAYVDGVDSHLSFVLEL